MGRNKLDGTPGKRKPPTLNERELALFNAVLSGKKFGEAARIAGYSTHFADRMGWQAFNRIKQKFIDVMEPNGLGPDEVVKTYLKPMLEATEVKVFHSKETGIIMSEPLVAWGPRAQALDMVHKIHGAYAKVESDGGTTNTTNNIQINNYIERPDRSAQKEAS